MIGEFIASNLTGDSAFCSQYTTVTREDKDETRSTWMSKLEPRGNIRIYVCAENCVEHLVDDKSA